MSKASRKRNQLRRAEKKRERLKTQCAVGWEKFSEIHWWRKIKGQRLDFWPSRGTVMWQGKVYRHVIDAEEFIREVCYDNRQ